MRSRIQFIQDRMETNLRPEADGGSGTPVTLVWKTWPSDSPADPVTGQKTGTPTEQRREIGAFLHFVNASSQIRQFVEIQVGDCIMDISSKVDLAGLEALVFLLPTGPNNGLETWTNKPMSSELSAMWDTMQAGRRIYQTVLLRKAL